MLKNTLKKLAAIACAAAICAQFAVMPTVSAKYIREDHSGTVLSDEVLFEEAIDKQTTESASTNSPYSFGKTVSGDATVTFDFSLNGNPAPGGTGGRDYNGCYMGPMPSKADKTGGIIGVTTIANGAYSFLWKDSNTATIDGSYQLGTTYTMKMDYHNLGTKSGTVDVTITDASGSEMGTKTGLGLRNISADGLSVSGMNFYSASADGEKAGWIVSNMKLVQILPNGIKVTLDGTEPADDYTKELAVDKATQVMVSVTATNNDNDVATAVTTEITMNDEDKTELPKGISYTTVKQNDKDVPVLIFDFDLAGAASAGGTKEYPLLITAYLTGQNKEKEKVEYPVTFTKGFVSDENQIDALYDTIVLTDASGAVIKEADYSNITNDFSFMKGNAKVSLTWDVGTENDKGEWQSDTSVINPTTGSVTPAEEDQTFIIKATAAVEGSAAAPKEKKFTVTVKGAKAVVDAAAADVTLVSADDATKTVDLTKLAEDVALATKSSQSSYIKFNWATSNTTNLAIKNNVAEVSMSKPGTATAELTATISYVRNGKTCASVTKKYPVTVVLDETTAEGKYAVRCDMLADNFGSVPSSGSEITDKIDLPTKGLFGSKITWSSSAPRALSNTGNPTPQSSRTTATLTATVSKGDASAKQEFKNLIVPAKSNSSSSSGGNGGGGKKNTNDTKQSFTLNPMTPVIPSTGSPSTNDQPKGFNDLGSVSWAAEAINALHDKGVIAGRSDTQFAPNDNVTRAEFAKIVMAAFGLEDSGATTTSFSDVKSGDWYMPYVASAYNQGIITGYEDGSFGVNDNITRQDMAVIIYRAARIAGKTINETNSAANFADAAQIAPYAKDAVTILQKAGVINGVSDTEFAPAATATRAQAAQMIYGLVK